jgi:signal transduction histidine kinase
VISDENGKPIEVNGYWTDVTELKKIEERLAESERLAAIGQTAAMVGHDLRNPLQGIAGALHLLRDDSLSEQERTEMLRLIEKSLEYSDAIVRDLTDFSMEIQLKRADTTPRSITRDALGVVKVPRNVTIQDSTEDQPTLRIDPTSMRRVFVNLVENAIDSMPQGGILKLSSKKSDSKVEIVLADSGSGVPEKVMENLWKPLQTTKAKGLGLGLAICKRVVDAHGGDITVKSKIGEGTSIAIRLPIKPDGREVREK